MSRNKQGTKAVRAERNQATQRALKERKQLRRRRADMHGAMTEAARMVRSKKRGTRDFDENMRTLGYAPRENTRGTKRGRGITGRDVLDKYEATS